MSTEELRIPSSMSGGRPPTKTFLEYDSGTAKALGAPKGLGVLELLPLLAEVGLPAEYEIEYNYKTVIYISILRHDAHHDSFLLQGRATN